MSYITMRGLSLVIARIGERIEWAARLHNIDMNEDEPLQEAIDELKHLANVLFDATEDESLNRKGDQ
jgi:hypothetical protein